MTGEINGEMFQNSRERTLYFCFDKLELKESVSIKIGNFRSLNYVVEIEGWLPGNETGLSIHVVGTANYMAKALAARGG